MTDNFADRLTEAVRKKKAPVCVGLDPLADRLPASFAGAVRENPATAIGSFCTEVIAVVREFVPAIKVNIAFFERHGVEGFRAYEHVVQAARDAGLLVIGDIKRGDIGHSTTQYALAHLGAGAEASAPCAKSDAVTVHPFMGIDSVGPFIDVGRAHGQGVFVLVQTSNRSAAEIQAQCLHDGRTVSEMVAGLVQQWASDEGLIGSSGYSCVGAVVAPHADVAATRRLREIMRSCYFLVPGFGAQGRDADDVRACFKSDGSGAIVNASRSVIYAYDDPRHAADGADGWQSAVRKSCVEFCRAVQAASRLAP